MILPAAGIYPVRHPEGGDFNLSAVEVFGVKAVAPFREGEKRPRRGKHLLPRGLVRDWIEKLAYIGVCSAGVVSRAPARSNAGRVALAEVRP